MRLLVAESDASWELVGSSGTELLMITDREAPLHRLLALDAVDGSAREVIAARDDRLESAVVAGGRLVVAWLHDASSRATVHDLDGVQLDVVPLPALGSVTGLEARADEAVVYLDWTTFTDPPAVMAYDVDSGELSTAFAPSTGSDTRPEQLTDVVTEVVTEQVWVTSRDGTRLPVFLLHRPDVTVDTGPHPAWLYGYGGFRIPMTPTFEPTRFAFAAAGGVVAVACLRGGGEYGAWWHDAGRRAYKQNTFDDAIAAASHLIDSGWTSTSRLAPVRTVERRTDGRRGPHPATGPVRRGRSRGRRAGHAALPALDDRLGVDLRLRRPTRGCGTIPHVAGLLAIAQPASQCRLPAGPGADERP